MHTERSPSQMSSSVSAPTASRATRPGYGPVRAVVHSAAQLSPTFLRIIFSGPEMTGVGSTGPVFDQRIKLIFPTPGYPLPCLPDDDSWYTTWLALPEDSRGSMRTYSIRELETSPDTTYLTVDFVLHLEPGSSGPAATWAAQTQPGDEILIIAPRREVESAGGIEFRPGDASRVVLAGDETAAPAIARILEDLALHSPEVTGAAFIEVPDLQDQLPVDAPPGVALQWLPRGDGAHGSRLTPAVLEHLGYADASPGLSVVTPVAPAPTAELLWETPVYSARGEELVTASVTSDIYYWIAGESGVVTKIRRHLVKEQGVDRSQVAFMGYWKHGVAMKG